MQCRFFPIAVAVIGVWMVCALPVAAGAAGPGPATVPAELDLETALALALARNPALAGAAAGIRAREAAVTQAGLWPNPEFSLEVENFAGTRERKRFDGAEITATLSQLVELGGKRRKRRQLAARQRELTAAARRRLELDLRAEVGRAFINVLVAQERLALDRELLGLAERTAAAVGERVEAGKVSPVAATRARVELATARSQMRDSVYRLATARRLLVSTWGDRRAGFERVTGPLRDFRQPPPLAALKAGLKENPDLLIRRSELERRRVAGDLAAAEAIPDLTVSAGLRNFQERNDNALVFGISLPLPIFDRNQGGMVEAREETEKARLDGETARLRLETELVSARRELEAAFATAAALRDEILPGAREVFAASELGYREGKFPLLRLLDAQRTLFAVRRKYLTALETYHLARIDLERLAGVPLARVGTAAAAGNGGVFENEKK